MGSIIPEGMLPDIVTAGGITIPPGRHRKVNKAKVKELAASMDRLGLLQPIIVRATAGGEVTIIAGAHRLAAAESLGWDSIPAYVLDESVDPNLCEQAEISENLHRSDLTPAQRAKFTSRWAKLIDEEEADKAKAAAEAAKNAKGKPDLKSGHDGRKPSSPDSPVKHGGARGGAGRKSGAVSKIAKEMGQPERTVRRDRALGDALTDAAVVKAEELGLDKSTAALEHAAKSKDEAGQLAALEAWADKAERQRIKDEAAAERKSKAQSDAAVKASRRRVEGVAERAEATSKANAAKTEPPAPDPGLAAGIKVPPSVTGSPFQTGSPRDRNFNGIVRMLDSMDADETRSVLVALFEHYDAATWLDAA